MTRCLLWGANSVVFAALAAHPNFHGPWAMAAGCIALTCWLRGFQVASRGG